MLPPPPLVPEPAPRSGIFKAPVSKPAESIVVERPNDASVARDTVVDPPPSRWQRLKDGAARFSESFLRDFFGTEPRLVSKLPPAPPLRTPTLEAEQGEKLLLAILTASPQYQHAAIEVARRALVVRHEGAKAYHELIVQFALSRLCPDEHGRIAITRLREVLPSLSFGGEFAPALTRLEEQGVVFLVLDTRDGDPMTELLRSKITHLELREPV
jgi:hypothetical protein